MVTCSIVGQKERINFIVTDNKQALDRLLEFMAKNVLAKHFDWIDYWKIKRIFTDIRPAYAMTVHKSQGSTFENVFVDAQDILSNPNREEALRCLYVAISRASNNVIVNI
jgi:superfamily I DNA/RNA helicase